VKKLLTAVCITATAFAAPATVASAKQPKPTGAEKKDAKQFCQKLRKSAGKQNFREMFGTGKNHVNAMRNCKRKQANELARERVKTNREARESAQDECRAERQADPAAFQDTYGSNGNRKNAFGKCVSQHAKKHRQEAAAEQDQEEKNELNAAKKCKAERKEDPDAFRKEYGTNANGRNAFGKCVSRKAREAEEQQQS
jgi:hypothetical protein